MLLKTFLLQHNFFKFYLTSTEPRPLAGPHWELHNVHLFDMVCELEVNIISKDEKLEM